MGRTHTNALAVLVPLVASTEQQLTLYAAVHDIMPGRRHSRSYLHYSKGYKYQAHTTEVVVVVIGDVGAQKFKTL